MCTGMASGQKLAQGLLAEGACLPAVTPPPFDFYLALACQPSFLGAPEVPPGKATPPAPVPATPSHPCPQELWCHFPLPYRLAGSSQPFPPPAPLASPPAPTACKWLRLPHLGRKALGPIPTLLQPMKRVQILFAFPPPLCKQGVDATGEGPRLKPLQKRAAFSLTGKELDRSRHGPCPGHTLRSLLGVLRHARRGLLNKACGKGSVATAWHSWGTFWAPLVVGMGGTVGPLSRGHCSLLRRNSPTGVPTSALQTSRPSTVSPQASHPAPQGTRAQRMPPHPETHRKLWQVYHRCFISALHSTPRAGQATGHRSQRTDTHSHGPSATAGVAQTHTGEWRGRGSGQATRRGWRQGVHRVGGQRVVDRSSSPLPVPLSPLSKKPPFPGPTMDTPPAPRPCWERQAWKPSRMPHSRGSPHP